MSGQPVVHSTDASKFREQYLATLSQQIKVDDKNLQANKIYKKTGQSPTIVLDTRTGSEKLADVYRLKMELRSGLKDIMDGANAERVVNEYGLPHLQFIAQRLPEIIGILKPKYKFGVPFVTFTTFMEQYIDSVQETGDYLAGFQQKSGNEILMGIRQIKDQMIDQASLDDVRKFLAGKILKGNGAVVEMIKDNLDKLEEIIPTTPELERMFTTQDAITSATIQKQLSDALEELPTRQQIDSKLLQLKNTLVLYSFQIGVKTEQIDDRRQAQLLADLQQLLAVPDETVEQMRLIRQELGQTKAEVLEQTKKSATAVMTDNFTRRQEEEQLKQQSESLSTEAKQELGDSYRPYNDLQTDTGARPADATDLSYTGKVKQERYIDRMLQGRMIRGDATKGYFNQIYGNNPATTKLSDEGRKSVIAEINKRIKILASPYVRVRNEGAEGTGVRTRKGRGVKGRSIVTEIDFSKGVMTTPPKYVPFGRFHINTNKLGDDIVNMRRHTGCNVYGLPVKRVSQDLGSVLRTIVGGGQPEYRQLEKLSDEEKIYLTNLVKKAQIGDRLSVPTPNKDDDDKDIHQYEVMKGEILSGNDNMDMVKKFKILIMKMMRKELLPKSQAKEILLDLATLGF